MNSTHLKTQALEHRQKQQAQNSISAEQKQADIEH